MTFKHEVLLTALALSPIVATGCATDPSPTTSELADDLHGRRDLVFTSSNDATDNSVLAFRRAANGALTLLDQGSTGGRGTSAGLGSQGALALSEDGRFLVVVNAGSNDVSSFAVHAGSLELRSRVSSGGVQPVSVAISDGLVYVVNAGGAANVSGLYLDYYGGLHRLASSTRALSGDSVGPAQIAFSPDGRAVVVTEKATNMIDTFTVHYDGRLSAGISAASAGQTPFGFSFTSRGQLVVSEAFGGAPQAGTVSSYAVVPEHGAARRTELISGPIPDLQSAPCWIAVTGEDRYAYTTNTASGTVSGYDVTPDGALSLFADGGMTADLGPTTKPTDLALDRKSRRLFVLASGTHELAELEVRADGTLVDTGVAASVPDNAVGLVAR